MKRGLTKRVPAALLVALLVVAGVVATTADAAPRPITFLAAIIESGPFKVTDAQNLAGIRFAVRQINHDGGINGRPVKLEVIDTELNAAVARRKAQNALLSGHISAIIGASGSDVLRALIGVGQRYHVPVFAFGGEADELTGSQFQPALFRIAASTSMHTASLVYALKHYDPSVTKVFLLNEDYSFGHASAEGFKQALKRLLPNVKIVGNMFHPRGVADFSPYLQKIQASGADFVLTSDWGSDLVRLLAQSKSADLKPRIAGTFLANPEILANVGDAAVGDLGGDVYLPTIDTPANHAFVKAWHKAHAGGPIPWPTNLVGKSYIATRLAAAAIQKAGSTQFSAVEKALEGLHIQSIAGPLAVRACDHQVLVGEAAGKVVAHGPFYSFPFVGPVLSVPLNAIEVPRGQTGNARCEKGA